MILGFLAVETPGQVATMLLGQRHGSGGRQRNALVGRAEQHIEVDTGLHQRGRIEASELGQRQAAVEQAGIEEVGAGAPGLEGELTETQHAAFDGKTDEFALIRLHAKLRTARIY